MTMNLCFKGNYFGVRKLTRGGHQYGHASTTKQAPFKVRCPAFENRSAATLYSRIHSFQIKTPQDICFL
jgi:hypothetical protein